MDLREFCFAEYKKSFTEAMSLDIRETDDDRRRRAQKFAIKQAVVKVMLAFPSETTSNIWRCMQSVYVHHFSGIDDWELLKMVKKAENSWKAASGYAFEELIKEIGNPLLSEFGLEIIHEKDLGALLSRGHISNRAPDIDRITHWKETKIFDLYLSTCFGERREIFGCVQTKTSIRDRVTRDREPSIQAMDNHFVSMGFVLEANELARPKYRGMVDGGTAEFRVNGWHAFYAFSDDEGLESDRIHLVDLRMRKFIEHAQKGAKKFNEERQWLDSRWNPAASE